MKATERDIHTIDAAGKAPGRLATEIAKILIGKNKASYTPNIDAGDHVQVLNASKMTLTGNKLEQKQYYSHTEHGQGLRILGLKALFTKDPSDVLRRAVSRMLPKNKLRNERLKRLIVKN
jgi:large subunit ribosomal protein L13